MIGMVLVTHGRLAAEFIAALEHVVGPQQRIAAVCIGADDDMEQRRRDILDSVAKVEEGDGVVLLTDMFGGTPSNLAISVLDRANVEVIAGVNLPMLIKLASVRNCWPTPEAELLDARPSLSRVATILNQRGLHARAAAKFVKLASQYEADIEVRRGDLTANGRSIMGLMMLSAGVGNDVEVSAGGPQAEAALAAVLDLIGRKFDED